MRNIFDVGEKVRIIKGNYRGSIGEIMESDKEKYILHMPDDTVKEYEEQSLIPINKTRLFFDIEDVLNKKYDDAYDLYMSGKTDDAYDLFKKILKQCEQCEGTELDDLKAKCKRMLGGHKIRKGEVVEGMKILNEAIRVLEENENCQDLGRALNSMGMGFEELGLLDQAIMYQMQALAVAQKIDDTKTMGYLNINIAGNYLKMKQSKQAEMYLKNSFKYFTLMGDKRMLPACDYMFGVFYQQNKDHNMAKEMFNKAIKGAEKNNDTQTLSQIYESYADLCETENDAVDEEKYLDLAISYYRREGNRRKVNELLERKTGLKNI